MSGFTALHETNPPAEVDHLVRRLQPAIDAALELAIDPNPTALRRMMLARNRKFADSPLEGNGFEPFGSSMRP
jgi:hypothetical protein